MLRAGVARREVRRAACNLFLYLSADKVSEGSMADSNDDTAATYKSLLQFIGEQRTRDVNWAVRTAAHKLGDLARSGMLDISTSEGRKSATELLQTHVDTEAGERAFSVAVLEVTFEGQTSVQLMVAARRITELRIETEVDRPSSEWPTTPGRTSGQIVDAMGGMMPFRIEQNNHSQSNEERPDERPRCGNCGCVISEAERALCGWCDFCRRNPP